MQTGRQLIDEAPDGAAAALAGADGELEAGVVAALEELVEIAIETSGAAAGCICLADGERQRIVAARSRSGNDTVHEHAALLAGIDGAAATMIAAERASSAQLPECDASALPFEFQARAPLEFTSGDRAGALYVFDVVARALEPRVRRVLQLIAERAAGIVELAAARARIEALAQSCALSDARLLEARASEGRRVGAELHAMLGYELLSSSLSLEAALPRLDGAHQDLDAIRGVATLLRHAIERWRDRVRAGYTAVPEPARFAAALRSYSAAIGREHGIKVQLHFGANVGAELTAVSAYHLQQLAVEAVVGAVRYSRGSVVLVDISREADAIVLRVEDDGVRASVDWSRERQAFHGIEALTHMLRGDLSIRPRRPGGLAVEVRLPHLAAAATDPAELGGAESQGAATDGPPREPVARAQPERRRRRRAAAVQAAAP